MGRGTNSKTMRKIQREFARGKVSVGRAHASSDCSSTLTQNGHRNTRRNNLKNRNSVTHKMMIYGTPTSNGVEMIKKTAGKCKNAECSMDNYNFMKEKLQK